MIVYVFVALYAACTALLLAVWFQDRRRGRGARRPTPDPRAAHEFVFRTQA